LKKTTTHLRYILYTIRGEKKKAINSFIAYRYSILQ
jgi:hypothetical protein